MVGTHWNRHSALLHQVYDFTDHTEHVYIALQVVVFKKIPGRISSRAAEVNKMDPVPKFLNKGRQVIIRTHTKRPCAKTKTVAERWNSTNQCGDVRTRTDHPG